MDTQSANRQQSAGQHRRAPLGLAFLVRLHLSAGQLRPVVRVGPKPKRTLLNDKPDRLFGPARLSLKDITAIILAEPLLDAGLGGARTGKVPRGKLPHEVLASEEKIESFLGIEGH